MRTIGYLLIIFLLRSNAVCAQESAGIHFFTGSWKAALAESKRQQKPIFVDVYTTWCGPCKQMARQAFPDTSVGKKFNSSFINYQIDAEKGEGIEVSDAYDVDAYPTSLYINANGDLIHRTVGYTGIKGMLAEADKAIAAASDPNAIVIRARQATKKTIAPQTPAAYLTECAQQNLPDGEALDAYLNTVPVADWTTTANLKLIWGNITSSDSKAFRVLMDSISTIRANPSYTNSPVLQKKVQAFAVPLLRVSLKQLECATTEADMERAIAVFMKLTTTMSVKTPIATDLEKTAEGLRRQFYFRTKNIVKYRSSALAEGNRLMAMSVDSVRAKNEVTYQRFKTEIASIPDSLRSASFDSIASKSMKTAETTTMSFLLISLAGSYYELMTDAQDLNQGLIWSARAMEYNRSSITLHIHAHLLNKLGRKAEAINMQEEAIVLAKAKGEKLTRYEEGLRTIRQP